MNEYMYIHTYNHRYVVIIERSRSKVFCTVAKSSNQGRLLNEYDVRTQMNALLRAYDITPLTSQYIVPSASAVLILLEHCNHRVQALSFFRKQKGLEGQKGLGGH